MGFLGSMELTDVTSTAFNLIHALILTAITTVERLPNIWIQMQMMIQVPPSLHGTKPKNAAFAPRFYVLLQFWEGLWEGS